MLYIIASPIGNLEDVTLRSIRILKEIDLIFCEDTRVTKKLLRHYEITKPLFRYIDDDSKINFYKDKLKSNDIALITDAGTPLLSDPGYKLINIARQNNIDVTSIPGSSALMTAVSLSGRKMNNFIFEGFFSKKSNDQLILSSKLKYRTKDTFLFDSPKRINSTLNFLKNKLLERDVIVFHELTKLNEKVISFNLVDLPLYDFKPLGEYIILISGTTIKHSKIDEDFSTYIKKEIEYLIANGLSLKNSAKIIADIFDLPRKDIYNIWIDKN